MNEYSTRATSKKYVPLKDQGAHGFFAPRFWKKDFLTLLNLHQKENSCFSIVMITRYFASWRILSGILPNQIRLPKTLKIYWKAELEHFKCDTNYILYTQLTKLFGSQIIKDGLPPPEYGEDRETALHEYYIFRDTILEPYNLFFHDIECKNKEKGDLKDLRLRWRKLGFLELPSPWGFFTPDNFFEFPNEVQNEIICFLLCVKEVKILKDLHIPIIGFIATRRY